MPDSAILSRLLVITAVEAESAAVLARLGPSTPTTIGPYAAASVDTPAGGLTVLAAGVGPAAAAAGTATALALGRYRLAVNLGVAGAFREGGAVVGGAVVATSMVAADLGAWAPDGFLDLSAIGLDGAGCAAPPVAVADAVVRRLAAAGVPVTAGPVLTLSAMTGTDARAQQLWDRHHAVAEAMEATGMATAAAAHGIPVAEVRTISNLVGDRDRESWELEPALATLADVAAAIFAEPLPC